MKTILFILGLSFNILLCTYPFQENIPVPTEINTKSIEVEKEAVSERKSLAYSDFLKNKVCQRKN